MELDGREETELGCDLASGHWGRGYATEAALAVIAHARRDLGLERLVSLVRAGNERSARVAERAGMTLERNLELGGIPYRLHATG